MKGDKRNILCIEEVGRHATLIGRHDFVKRNTDFLVYIKIAIILWLTGYIQKSSKTEMITFLILLYNKYQESIMMINNQD